jgi:CheY-like chemotaxis protein
MVEPDADDRHLTSSVFEENNYNIPIHFLYHYNELLPYLSSCKAANKLPDLILLNMQLETDDGIDIVRKLKEDDAYKEIPVVVLSDSSQPSQVKEVYRAGANSFIKKPFSGEETIKTIDSFIRYWFQTAVLPSE